jgi:arginyl-tRNA synthetase
MLETLRLALIEALRAQGVGEPVVTFDYPELVHGDLTTNVALVYAKTLGIPPRALAESLVQALPPTETISSVSVAGPGFINITFTAEAIRRELSGALVEPDTWGEGNFLAEQEVMVEYTQPNPFKPFHIGHLMSNTIGESLVRLLEAQGAKVIRANYQGDVGPHVAKAIWGVAQLGVDPTDVEALGKAYAHGAQQYEQSPEAKRDIDELNRLVYERSDAGVNDVYDKGRAASLARFEELYAILGTSFDRYYFESETAPLGQRIVETHPEVFPESEGARVFKGEEHGLHTRVFITAKGFPTYEAKELGLETLKDTEYPECDEFIITTAVEQKSVFEVIKAALSVIKPDLAQRLSHISHGMMRLEHGKMSSRLGVVVTGEYLLSALKDAALDRAKESRAVSPEALAQDIAVAAIKFQILKQAAGNDIVFNEERALSLEGDSGPYMQYAFARSRSLIEKAAAVGIGQTFDAGLPITDIERMAFRFPSVVARAALERAPHHVAQYVIVMSSLFNEWYARERVLESDHAPHLLAVAGVAGTTIRQGLELLGIPVPEKM